MKEDLNFLLIINQFLGGQIRALALAHDAGCVLRVRIASSAAQFGHLHVLEWLQGHGCEMNEYMCVGAAEAGQLEVCLFLISFLA